MADGYFYTMQGTLGNSGIVKYWRVQGAPATDDSQSGYAGQLTNIQVYSFSNGLSSLSGAIPTGPATGDLEGTYPNPTVSQIQARSISPASPSDGQVLTWVNADAQWEPKSPTTFGNVGGDLGGALPNPTVQALQGRAVASTVPSTGQYLSWLGTNWAPTTLPPGNFTPGQDLTGSSTSQTVIGIDGYALSGKPNPGQALVSNGTQLVPTGMRQVYNVLAYGAVNGQLSASKIQNAIDDAGVLGTVYLPPGDFLLETPLWITKSGATLFGEGNATAFAGPWGPSALLRTGNYYGPTVIVEGLLKPGVSNFPRLDVVNGVTYLHAYGTATPPANTAQEPFIKLNSIAMGNLNGLSQMTFECNVIPHGDSLAGTVAVSAGRRTDRDSASHHKAFTLTYNSGSTGPVNLTVNLSTTNTTNANFTVNSALPIDGYAHALAVTYDGYFARLYVDGYYEGKVSATGHIVQPWYEGFFLGATSDNENCTWPNPAVPTGNCSFANVRLSTTARYTGEGAGRVYSPPLTSNLTFDGYTQALILFDSANIQNTWVVGRTNGAGTGIGGTNSPCWYKIQGLLTAGPDGLSNVTIQNIGVQSWQDGIIAELCTFLDLEGCNIEATRCFYGYNNCYYGSIETCAITPFFQQPGYFVTNTSGNTAECWGIGYNGASGIHSFRDVAFGISSGWSVMLAGSGGNVFENLLVNTTNGYGGLFCNSGSFVAQGLGFGDEGNVGFSDYMCIFNNCYNVIWENGVVEITNPGSTAPALMAIDGGGNFSFALDFTALTVPAVHIIAPPSTPIELQGSSQFITLGSAFYPQPSNLLFGGPWFDGYGTVLFSAQERMNNTINFASDANLTVGRNDFLWGILTITDTGSVLSTSRSVFLPDIGGYRRTIRNQSSKTLTVGSRYTGTVSITAGSTVELISYLVPVTGTVTPHNGSFFDITGSGTSFTSQLFVGEPIYLSANTNPLNQVNFPFIVATITDDTHLTVINQLAQASGSSQNLLVPQWKAL
jgi:hypothetical protein